MKQRIMTTMSSVLFTRCLLLPKVMHTYTPVLMKEHNCSVQRQIIDTCSHVYEQEKHKAIKSAMPYSSGSTSKKRRYKLIIFRNMPDVCINVLYGEF